MWSWLVIWGCGGGFCAAVRSESQRVISGQGQTYFFKSTCTQHDPSELQDPGQKTTKPMQGCRCVCVCEHDNKPVFFPHLFQITHDADQTVLGIEHPNTGMFTFDKSNVMLSQQLLTRTHTQTHNLTIHLWWFKPCPSVGVKRGVSSTDELRKTGLFEITPTERMHSWVNATQARTQRHS